MISDGTQRSVATESVAEERSATRNARWRLRALAFVPTLVLGLTAFSVQLPYLLKVRFNLNLSAIEAEEIVTVIAWFAGLVPFAMPVYLYFLGRRYVRVVHAGLKSPGQFAFMYSAANVGVWLLVSCLLAPSFAGR